MTGSDQSRQRRGRIFIIGFVLVLMVVVGTSLFTNLTRMAAQDAARAQQSGPVMKLEALEIVSGDTRRRFRIELAKTDADRGRGLMFRQSMPADQGMLFDFERDQMVSMWMRNTFISLDMVFIFSDGLIHRIEPRTEVQSERTISSGVPVRAVLELNAGTAEKLGIKPGDRVIHTMFR
ncbi:COG1430 Uncharacterized conserved protein [Rhabdaerophilaceae bacterium]